MSFPCQSRTWLCHRYQGMVCGPKRCFGCPIFSYPVVRGRSPSSLESSKTALTDSFILCEKQIPEELISHFIECTVSCLLKGSVTADDVPWGRTPRALTLRIVVQSSSWEHSASVVCLHEVSSVCNVWLAIACSAFYPWQFSGNLRQSGATSVKKLVLKQIIAGYPVVSQRLCSR